MRASTSLLAVLMVSCGGALPAAAPPSGDEDITESRAIANWLRLARGEDPLVDALASDFVRTHVQDARIAALEAGGTAVRDPEHGRMIALADIDLTVRVLAEGLAHADDPDLVALGRTLRGMRPIDDAGRVIAVYERIAPLADDERSVMAVERLQDLWPEGSFRPPSRDELARAALVLVERWLSVFDPAPRPPPGPFATEICLSGGSSAYFLWTPASTVAFAIAIGADPGSMLDLVYDHLEYLVAEARALRRRELADGATRD